MKKKPEQRKRIGSPATAFTCNSSVSFSDNISKKKERTQYKLSNERYKNFQYIYFEMTKKLRRGNKNRYAIKMINCFTIN